MTPESVVKPLSTDYVRKFWKKVGEANTIRYGDKEAIERAYAAGLREGARRERRALRRFVRQGGVFISNRLAEKYISANNLIIWLASRRRKEGKK